MGKVCLLWQTEQECCLEGRQELWEMRFLGRQGPLEMRFLERQELLEMQEFPEQQESPERQIALEMGQSRLTEDRARRVS